MNKKELIQEVAIRSGMSQADVEKTLNHIMTPSGTVCIRKTPSHLWDSELSGCRNMRNVRGIILQPVRKCRFLQRRLLNSNRVKLWKLSEKRKNLLYNKKKKMMMGLATRLLYEY